MAIDTEDKRKSATRGPTGFPQIPGLMTGPVPDGAFDAGDRQHLTALYRGIAAGGAPVGGLNWGLLLGVYR